MSVTILGMAPPSLHNSLIRRFSEAISGSEIENQPTAPGGKKRHYTQKYPKNTRKTVKNVVFRVQSEKFYTWQNYFTRAPPVVPVTNIRYVHALHFRKHKILCPCTECTQSLYLAHGVRWKKYTCSQCNVVADIYNFKTHQTLRHYTRKEHSWYLCD